MINKISITTLFALLTFGVWAQYFPVSSTDTVYPEGIGFRANLTQATKVRPVTPAGGTLTMTTHPGNLQTISVLVVFVGNLTVDWGDGTSPEQMVTDEGGGTIYNSHKYTTSADYEITITGDIGQLTLLFCNDMLLTAIDISNCTGLTTLYCYNNQLTSIDLSNCANLSVLLCYYNSFSESSITSLIESMPDRTGEDAGIYIIVPMSETYPQTLTEGQSGSLTTKNWVQGEG